MKGMLEEAKADTLVMVSGADDLPGLIILAHIAGLSMRPSRLKKTLLPGG